MLDRENVISDLKSLRDDVQNKDDFIIMSKENALQMLDDVLALLKEHEVRELTIEEWRKWKENPRRDPICKLWENDTSPMWILSSEDVHEPALLMGKLKLFTGKPTFEQCKEVKWE